MVPRFRLSAFGLIVAMTFTGAEAFASSALPPAPPKVADLPPGELGAIVKLGKLLVEQTATHPLTRDYVKNRLTCASCHPNAGTDPKAATFIGVATAYPAYSPREKAVIALEDRVLNCFMRSMGGLRPPLGSVPSVAITAYITWLSQGQPIRMNPSAPLGPYSFPKLALDPEKADLALGERVYGDKCAACHGGSGEGVGDFPPVWGEQSYNMGAGLAETNRLASWLKVAMPPGSPDLQDKEALDVAAYLDSKPRPGFVLKDHLPPPDRLGVYNAKALDEVKHGPPGKTP